ncbi:MAG: hypothetical protein JSR46_01025 [Verrucomicrobia bacterium]|nr:hypothetical protein [Verrucomicrobiota bacterium]
MDPNYLKNTMQAKASKKEKSAASKDKFEQETERMIETYVDTLELEDDPAQNHLLNIKMRKERLKQEMREALKLPELSKQIESAIGLLLTEGARYLTREANQTLQSDLSHAAAQLEGIEREKTSSMNLQAITKISDASMKAITDMAIAKFTEERFQDCLCLFSFLTILDPGYSEYWLRLGIAAQQCENYEMASRAYAAALELDPGSISAHLFAAECFVKCVLLDKAKAELAAAKKIAESSTVDQTWLDLLSSIENMVRGQHA